MQTDIKNIHSEIMQHADSLLACLNNELDILNSGKYDDLVSVANEKQLLVQFLNDLDKKRESLIADKNYSARLNQLDSSGSLLKQWNLALDTIRQCNQQNEVNGRLINKLNQISRETLDIFTGHNSSADITYSSEGLKKGSSTQLTNTRA